MSESNPESTETTGASVDNVEGDVNVTNEAPATEATTPSETDDSAADISGDDAQQDTGAYTGDDN